MKTRIQKIEYNNGIIKYECQINTLEKNIYAILASPIIIFIIMMCRKVNFERPEVMFFSSILLVLIGYCIYDIILRWQTMCITDIYEVEIGKQVVTNEAAVFNNLNDAKRFIDNRLKKESDNNTIKNEKKIKTKTIIKYP